MSGKQPCKKQRKSSHSPSPSTPPQWLCAHPEAQKNINKKGKCSPANSLPPVVVTEVPRPSSPSLYHPKKSYSQRRKLSKIKVKVVEEVKEVKEEEATCCKPPSPLVFTEDLYSNYDWGLGDSPSGEFPPPPIQFSDEM